jgi:hypothetical protein
MANRTFRQPLGHLKPDRVHVTARFVGNTTSTGTIPTADNPYITSINRTGAGVHTIVWSQKFAGTVDDPKVTTIGTTAGLQGRFTALDAAAGTATVTTEVGATATDAATTDTVYLSFWVRNSAKNQ